MATPASAPEADVQVVHLDPSHPSIATPETFNISKTLHQQVKWESAGNVPFRVKFEGETPFHESEFYNEYPYSGEARRKVEADPKKVYKYNVTFGSQSADPGGIIGH